MQYVHRCRDCKIYDVTENQTERCYDCGREMECIGVLKPLEDYYCYNGHGFVNAILYGDGVAYCGNCRSELVKRKKGY